MVQRKRNNQSLSEALEEFIATNKLQLGIDKVNVKDAWKKLMGNGVNNYTSGVDLKQGTLFISLTSSVLREELSHGKSKIIAMLNEELGKDLVKKIVLR